MKFHHYLLFWVFFFNFPFQMSQAQKTSLPVAQSIKICNKSPLSSCFWPNMRNIFQEIPGDLLATLKFTFHSSNYHSQGLTFAMTGAAIVIDEPITTILLKGQKITMRMGLTEKSWTPHTWQLPGFMIYDSIFSYLLPLIHGYAMFSNNSRLYRASYLSIKSWFYSIFFTIPFRFSFKRDYIRLGENNEIQNSPWSSFWGSDDRTANYPGGLKLKSFPSFRSAMWFSVADIFSQEYKNTWLPYSLATTLTLLGKKHHWFSDILFGAFLGVGISRALQHHYYTQASTPEKNLKIYPTLAHDSVGLTVSWEN
ncbi:MAG: hypothetical protein HYW47_07615 [Deltaproteobacteria bacterium]|nr:hypothetical protein [Deltaproteobacteria bacterium]